MAMVNHPKSLTKLAFGEFTNKESEQNSLNLWLLFCIKKKQGHHLKNARNLKRVV